MTGEKNTDALYRVDRILRHPLWQGAMEQIRKDEETRTFCRHDLDHALHVARLAYIEVLTRGPAVAQELVYAAALLHDIGRGVDGPARSDHAAAGCALAGTILAETGFSAAERQTVTEAIAAHRVPETAARDDLAGLLYRADKEARACFACPARADCYWPEEQKNQRLRR